MNDRSLTFLVVEIGRQSLCNSTDPSVIRLCSNFHSVQQRRKVFQWVPVPGDIEEKHRKSINAHTKARILLISSFSSHNKARKTEHIYNTFCLGTKKQAKRIKILLKQRKREMQLNVMFGHWSAANYWIWKKSWGGKKVLCTLDTSSAWDMDINQMDGISIPDAQDYRNM